MADIREDILARLVAVVATVPNLRTVQRNNTDIPSDDQLPAAMILDGDEDVVSGNDRSSRLPGGSLVVEMTPEIQIIEQSGSIGSDLTAFRTELIKLILFDTALNQQTGSNGKISYLGCVTSFGWLEKQYGALQLQFKFKYPLIPNEL
jgi:hypothetical protein